MDNQTCANCGRRCKETGKCTLPMRSDMKPNGWCYRWLPDDPEFLKEMGIGEDVWNVINNAAGKKN